MPLSNLLLKCAMPPVTLNVAIERRSWSASLGAKPAQTIAAMFLRKVEGAAHTAEHAESHDIDLHPAQDVDVVLVPLDDLAVLHGRRFDGHQFVEPVTGQHETARMLAEMPGKADQLPG